ncbi:hypothetical protein [Nocardia huaxiensis]|uniref:Uncharacterized protein n=1 Tax=Nocardia huaxiensis TaxID=2755382 RepID=A0A7D6VNP1_9NOCA|nr:hypothetical protein [Nocardia huaxiensis]QLY33790.1 hypothetical protein H0264_17510 [Nocardia huaxiensis]UFS99285.1 hypothetical protein LPY97_16010 [Nocardia huaxiensis]
MGEVIRVAHRSMDGYTEEPNGEFSWPDEVSGRTRSGAAELGGRSGFTSVRRRLGLRLIEERTYGDEVVTLRHLLAGD